MSPYDIIVLVIVAGLGVLGFWRGFVREIIETVGAIVSALLTYKLYSEVAQVIGIDSQSGWVSTVAVIIGLFIAIMVVISIIGYFIRRFIRTIHLGMYDHLLGLMLGAAKGGVLVSVLVSAALWVGPPGEKIVSESKLVRANLLALDIISDALPEPIRQRQVSALAGQVTSKVDKVTQFSLHQIPARAIDSVFGGIIEGRLNVLEVIRSAGYGAVSEERIEGTVSSWDAETLRGTIRFFSDSTEKHIPCYFGSLADSQSALALQVGDPVRFRLVFSDFLNEVCAADAELIVP